MLIERLRFKDFFLFSDLQEMKFEFKQNRNVTVVLAPNNAGKTTVIRALRFLLFNETEHGPEKVPSLWAIQQAAPNTPHHSYVEATVLEGDRRMTLQRGLKWERKRADSLEVRIVTETGHVFYHESDGDKKVSLSQAPETLATLVPRSMFDFFFFKGEELASHLLRPSAADDIPSEVKKLLYFKEFEDLLDTFVRVKKKLSQKLDQSERRQAEYTQALEQQDALQRAVDQVKAERSQVGTQAALQREGVNELERQLRELHAQANPERKQRLEDLATRIQRLRNDKDQARSRLHRILGKDFVWILLVPHLEPAREALRRLHKKRALPPDISEGLLGKILEDGTCICGGDCSEGTPARARLSDLRRDSLSESLSSELWTMHNKLREDDRQGYCSVAEAHRVNLAEVAKRRDAISRELRTAEGEYAKLEPLVDGSLEEDYRRLSREKEQAVRALESRQRQEQALATREADMMNRLRKAQADARRVSVEGVPAALSRSIDMSQRLAELSRQCLGEIQDRIGAGLPRHLSDLYAEIVTDGSSARIDSATLLPRIERAGIIGLGTGGAQQQTLVLCYLISLARLRRELNESLDSVFGIPAFRQQAFFMDSVFGQMQDEYRGKVASVLAKELQQAVLLVASQQWSDRVQDGLGGHVTAIYGFEHWTPKDVDATDFFYSLGGASVRLYKRTPPNEQARTVIRRLR